MKERVRALYEFLRKPEHLTARSVTAAKLSRVVNAALALGKIGLGVYSLSLFLCVNGFYNVGIAAAKHFAVRVQEGEAAQLLTYRRVGGWLTFTSALYIVYAANMAARGRGNVQYDTIWLHMKRLEKGRFHWPGKAGGGTMGLTRQELGVLIGGARLPSKLKRRDVFKPGAA